MSFLAEKILRQPGQDPNLPRVILAAPTGKAASIIGESYFTKESCKRLALFKFFIIFRWDDFTFCI